MSDNNKYSDEYINKETTKTADKLVQLMLKLPEEIQSGILTGLILLIAGKVGMRRHVAAGAINEAIYRLFENETTIAIQQTKDMIEEIMLTIKRKRKL